jgi:hypothetical protein
LLPIVVTLSGMITEVNGHPANAKLPMDVTLFPMLTDVRGHPTVLPNPYWPVTFQENAESLIEITLSGMIKDVREVRPWNVIPNATTG